MNDYRNITKLLGYTDDQIIKVEDSYTEPWLSTNGLKLSIKLDDSMRDIPIHFISKEKKEELILINREESFNILDGAENEILVPKWKVGDMCYFEYKIHYISDMRNGMITGCAEDFGGTHGNNLNDRCFKVTPFYMRCSKSVNFYYKWISELGYNITDHIINMPDIHGALVDLWVKLCQKEDNAEYELSTYSEFIIKSIKDGVYDATYINDEGDEYGIFKGSSPIAYNLVELTSNSV